MALYHDYNDLLMDPAPSDAEMARIDREDGEWIAGFTHAEEAFNEPTPEDEAAAVVMFSRDPRPVGSEPRPQPKPPPRPRPAGPAWTYHRQPRLDALLARCRDFHETLTRERADAPQAALTVLDGRLATLAK